MHQGASLSTLHNTLPLTPSQHTTQTNMFLRPMLALLPLLLSLPCTSTNLHHESKSTQSMMRTDPTERETLFLVMESLSSDRDWRAAHPDPCRPGSSWPGIECKPASDNHLHVSRLLFGTPPTSPSCKKTATFPSEIFNLPHLQSLLFLNCFTTTKTTLSIPLHSLSAAASLQQLSLKSNPALVGTIPPQIASLTSLQVLTLSQNRLSGRIPVDTSGLKSLGRIYHLNLSRNQLGGVVPFNAGFFRRLGRNMDLSGNPGLCLKESESSVGIKVGVAVCGANSSGSPGQAMSSGSEGAPSLILPCMHSLLGVWGLYRSLV